MDVIPIENDEQTHMTKEGNFLEILDEMKDFRKDFRKHRDKTETTFKDLDSLIRLSKEVTKNSFLIIDLIEKLRSNITFIPDNWKVLKNLEIMEKTVRREKVRFQSEFISELTTELKKIEINLAGTSPNFFIRPFHFVADFKQGNGKILFGQEEIESKIPLKVSSIISLYKKRYKTICERSFDETKFLETLYQAYLRVLKLNDTKLNRKANIRETFEEFVFLYQTAIFRKSYKKKHFSSYPICFFLYDLRICKNFSFENQKLSLITATIDATNKKNSILLPDLDGKENRYIMAVEFVEIKK